MTQLLSAETFQEYTSRLKKSGMKELGQGSFGIVFNHPKYKNVVVKIVRYDPANRAWLNFCHKHKTNPYLPKLYGVHRLTLDSAEDAYVVFMEKLFAAPVMAVVSLNKYIVDITGKHNWKDPKTWKSLAQVTPDQKLKQVAEFLAAMNPRNLDLHQANFMVREPKQLVFTDPVAS